VVPTKEFAAIDFAFGEVVNLRNLLYEAVAGDDCIGCAELLDCCDGHEFVFTRILHAALD
jgi:polyferredoxin